MRLASKAALLLSPDLRAVARDAREALQAVTEAIESPDGPEGHLEVAEAALDRVLQALEGRSYNRG